MGTFWVQNQHFSSQRFLILLKKTAECQWPVRICAAVLATVFLAPSAQDFLGGVRLPSFLSCPEPLRSPEFEVRDRGDPRCPGFPRSCARELVGSLVSGSACVSLDPADFYQASFKGDHLARHLMDILGRALAWSGSAVACLRDRAG